MLRGEVWWIEFPQARGGEIQKTRPAIIVSNDSFNRTMNRVQVVPVTSNTKKLYPGEALVTIGDRTSKALVNQIATVTKERVQNRIGAVSTEELAAVEKAIVYQLALEGGT
ncbi:MAG: type II toxin-antitoxin system PemK/MazF family toxin [Rhodospirillaceae bacterium]|nr:type II toxin-antitoxin system PemK/MazF family toxin [Rhodospirillaceae bacterium]